MSGTIVAGGPAVPVTTSTPGDTVQLTFSGSAGQRVFALFSNNTINPNCCNAARAYILNPDGSNLPLGTQSDVSPYGGVYFYNNSLIDTVTLPTSGTYTLVLAPTATETGSATVTLYDVPADPTASVSPSSGAGSSAVLTTTTPGQNLSVTFSGSAGQRVFALFSNNTINPNCCNAARAYILNPDGSNLPLGTQSDVSPYGGVYFYNNSLIDTVTLPTSGTYTLVADPQRAQIGNATVTLYDVPADPTQTVAIGGASQSLTTTTPGQNLAIKFTGSAGQPVSAQFTNNTINPNCCNAARAYILKPDGSNLPLGTQSHASPYGGVYFYNGSGIDQVTLPVNGTYTLVADPQRTQIGSATFSLTRSAPFQPTTQTYGTCRGAGVQALSASACTADPVNSLTGAFTTSATDLSEASTGLTFAFTRSYTSADTTAGTLGPGWTNNYAASLAVQANGDVQLHGDDGQQVSYVKQPDGSFLGAGGALATLTTISGGYQLVRHDQVTYRFDATGVLQSELDRNGQGLTFTYDTSGRLWTIVDAAGHTVTLAYNASNLLSTLSTPDGRTVSYGYTSGRLTSVTLPDPDGAGPLTAPVWTYTYETGGRLWQEIDPNNHAQVTNVYDPTSGRVTQQTDGNNKTTNFSWDDPTQTATITDPDNHVWKDIYQNNVLIKRIDPAGDTTQFGHDLGLDTTGVTAPNGTDTTAMNYQNGNLMTATVPASLGSGQKTFTYDSQNNVKTITDARNKLTQFGYDPAGNNNSITLDGQQTFAATYNAQGQMLTSTDGNNKQTSYTYDSAGNLASMTAPDPDGVGPLQASKTTYTYDAMGNQLTKVDPLGNCSGCIAANYTTSYTYDANGRLLTETDPLGHTTTHVYDAAGNETSVTDANGHTTSNVYDGANHLIQSTGADPDGAGPLEAPITKYTYDDTGNKLTMVGPRGNCSGCNPAAYTTAYTYNQNNQMASATTPKGETTSYTYDANGNLAAKVDPRGNVAGCNCAAQYTTSYTYDAAGRLLTMTDPLGHVSTNHYDSVGNRDSTKDANLHQTSYTYDAAGRVLTITAPDGGVTTSTYDGNGNITTRKDDNNHTTTYTYDDAGRLIQTTGQDPDGAGPLTAPITTKSYDLNGNLTSTTDPNGNATPTAGDGTTSYSYDHANRLTATSYSDSTPPVGYGYDNVGNRTSMTDGAGSVSYGYDNLNRLSSATRGTDVFSYSYDVASNLTSRTYPDATQTSYSYDEDNRLASASSGGNTTSYAYDPASDLTQTTLPAGNGYVETRSYDAAARLTEVKNAKGAAVLSDFASTLDPVGDPTQIVQSGATSGTQTYTYDANDRIQSVCFQAGTCPASSDPFIRWTYDKVGNRLTEARHTSTNTVNTTYSYNAGDELTLTSAQTNAPYSGQAQTDGAQPYWRLGEASGPSFASNVGSYPGTWTGSPTLAVTGALGNDSNTAATLNPAQAQTGQYGTVANASGLNKTNNFSLELWVKRSKNAVSQAVVGKPLTATTKSENYAIWIDTANDARFEVGAGTKSATVTCTAHPLDTGWHHIVGTFASGALKIYYDGTVCNSATATFTSASTNTSTFDVGRAGTSSYYGGSLDELAIYGTALSTSQVADHYSKGINTANTTAASYDNNGNETANGSRSFSYDLANRLSTTTLGSTTTTYSYDGDGNRLQASTGTGASQKTNYLWDTNGSLPGLALERDGSNTLLRRYIYGEQRISMYEGGASYYYHYDPLGSVVNLTSAAGTTEWTDSYEPYGATHSETQNDPFAPVNVMKFAGEYLDPTGLYHLGARQYDPTAGRFLSQDPLDGGADNHAGSLYLYANDNPTQFGDPTGEGPFAVSTVFTTMTSSAASPADVEVFPIDGGDLLRWALPFPISTYPSGGIDQGVDYAPTVAVKAIMSGNIYHWSKPKPGSWSGHGAIYEHLDLPAHIHGRSYYNVYYAEEPALVTHGRVSTGQHVMAPGGDELGFANDSQSDPSPKGPYIPRTRPDGSHWTQDTREGHDFQDFLWKIKNNLRKH